MMKLKILKGRANDLMKKRLHQEYDRGYSSALDTTIEFLERRKKGATLDDFSVIDWLIKELHNHKDVIGK